MPARTVSSAGTARGSTVIPKKVAGTPLQRLTKGQPPISKEDVKGKRAEILRKEDGSDGRSELVLSAIKLPKNCTKVTVEKLVTLLGTSITELDVTLTTSTASSSKVKLTSKLSSASIRQTSKSAIVSKAVTEEAIPVSALSESKRTHLAKLVVNAVIASLNDLIGQGWKLDAGSDSTADRSSSRSTTASSSTSTSSSATLSTRTAKPASSSLRTTTNNTAVTESNVTAIFDCARVAVHFLISEANKGSMCNMKEAELELILTSIIRKVVAMDMHHLASLELDWLHAKIEQKYTASTSIHSIEYAIPNTVISTRLCEVILDVQALSLTTSLFLTPISQIADLFTAVTRQAGGPLSWQHYVRSAAKEEGKESADRHAYSVERSMTKFLSRHAKAPESIDAEVVLQCRKLSLDFLLFVSGLDQDAFWDRTARVASSYIRSKTASESTSIQEKKSDFLVVDDVLRDVVRRAEQMQVDLSTSSSTHKLQGKGFSSFCEVWIQLAQRAGEAQSIHHIAGLLAGNDGAIQGVQLLSEEQVDGLITQLCARLSQSVIAAGDMLQGEVDLSALKTAEVEVDAGLRLANLATSEALAKIFKVLDQLRRRMMRLLDDQKVKVDDATPLLVAICKHYEQYLESDSKAHLEDDEAILDDCIYVLRSLANSGFVVSDLTTHEASAGYLGRCDALVSLRQGKMEHICDAARCNKMRLLSSSWYYIGGQLYNDKKLPLAIRFLKLACETAQAALDLYDSLSDQDRNGTTESVKRPEGTAKKWEHLAVSYRHTSQMRLSYEAFLNALQCTENKAWKAIASKASTSAIGQIFSSPEQDKNISDVASVAKACFEVAAFDLLLYHNKSEKDWAHRLLQRDYPREGIGALLEQCLLSLDSTMHREEAPQAALYLIDLLLSLYDPLTMPIRRSRLLLRKLEFAAMQPQLFSQAEDIQSVLSIAQELEQLLGQKEHSRDSQLVHFIPQYMMMLSLLQLLKAASSIAQSDILLFASQSSARLKNIVAGFSPPSKRTLKTTNATKQQPSKILPVTPPKGKKASRVAKAPLATSETVSSAAIFDDASRLFSLIELAVEVLSSQGHTFASIELLKISKQLAEALLDDQGPNQYLQYTAALTRQYLWLGITGEAGSLVTEMKEALKKEQRISLDTRARCLLSSANYHCHIGQMDKSEELYHASVKVASSIEPEGRMSSLQTGIHRCLTHERQALAAESISIIRFASGDLVAAVRYAVLSVRSAMKAGLVLSRLTASADSKGQDQSPFVQVEKKEKADGEASPISEATPAPPPPRLNSSAVAILYWRMIRTLYLAYMRVAGLYKIRGSARDAEGFMGEAIDFASSVQVPQSLGLALIERGRIRMQMASSEKGEADLEQAAELIGESKESWVGMKMAMAKAEEQIKASSLQEALQHYENASSILDALTVQYKQLANALGSPTAKKVKEGTVVKSKVKDESLFPTVRGKLLLEQAWLLTLLEREEDGRRAMDEAAVLLQRGSEKQVQCVYQAKMEALQSMRVLKADPVMGMLPESAVSMPMITADPKSCSKILPRGAITKTAISRLEAVQSLLDEVINGTGRLCMDSVVLRDACAYSVTSYTLASVLQGGQSTVAADVVSLHQCSSALTLQREMQDAVEVKLESKTAGVSIPGWQLSSRDHSTQYRVTSSEETSEDKTQDDDPIKSEWNQVCRRHNDLTSTIDLPPDWTVISITLHRERNCLVLSRLCGASSQPIIISLPIDRQNRREGEEDAVGVDAVLQELKSIIERSNTATHSAQHLEGMQARKEWWSTRRELDNRLKELLAAIEVSWLGAFKSLFLPRPNASVEDLASLRSSFEAVFQRAFFSASTGSKKMSQVGLDDSILECMSALSMTSCTDEELEDLIHFVMDAYQFHGMPVAVDEIDMDLCVTELRGALESFKTKCQADGADADRHVFLILDKNTCAIPWESIPLLRKQAVCRIPSLAFLADRLEQTRKQATPSRFSISSERAKVWYLLNPSKDLTRTQDRFLPWLEKQSKWTGVCNRAPIMDEMAQALESNDVVFYFGHGGGEQYLRPSRLRGLKKCAVTMLWGCSSGVLKDLGDFDRSGTPYNYLMAGCPSLLGNLWDATDKELDGISESVLEKMGFKQGKEGGESPRVSIAQAVAQSRDACKLPYLTGAACVVYGIPVYVI